ncbi:CopG family transcriptional regulator [Sphingomonas donggukensis]|uniref:CopG family transcriptional regulator n=1 Tax=Sphingomonas donggukensis TaxID=2949093 RepID=A0ABY4TTZ0_9SPHN|nr:CopG family transcriptional regulator [Sphingomonas donggukensis]URW75875.1 CopG family transcriptional regulator [Sphingomonas donggukensis]
MPARKAQLTIYLEPATLGALEAFARKSGSPKSLVAEAAVASFLTGDDADRRDAATIKRLDRIIRLLDRLERNDTIALETHALFIRFWLTATPALPEQGTPAARAKGQERYERFIEALGRRVASGTRVGDEIALDLGLSDAADDLRPHD